MAGAAVLASNAIGALFSTCVGGVEGGKGVPTSEQQAKRKRGGSARGGAEVSRRGALGPPGPAQAHPPKGGEWWTGSSDEMENEVARGMGAAFNNNNNNNVQGTPSAPVSGSSTPLNDLPPGSVVNTSSDQFVNHALILWNERRRQWVGTRSRNRVQPRNPCIREDATYEDLLATSRPFSQPVPLPEMVEFLVDVWEQEGLYD